MKSPVAAVFAVLLIPAAVFAASREKEDPIALNNRAVTAMDKGRFKEAIQLLQRAVQMNPEDTLVENLATAMNNLGVQYLNDTEPDKAMRWLQQAQEVRADDRINKNLAQALIMKGRFESEEGRPELAQQYFRDAVLTDPESRSAHESLGRSLYEQGRLKESLASVERALEIEDREELRAFSEKIRKQMEGEKDFFEQRGSHFRIFYSPDLPAQSVSTIAWKLDRAYESHRMALGGAPKGEIPAVLYSSRDKFAGTHDLTSNVVGIFSDGKVRLPIPDEPDWEAIEQTLSHEVAHAFLFDLGGPDIPVWLNEGLAEFLSVGPDRPTRSLDRARETGDALVPIKDLSDTLRNFKNNTKVTLAYDQAFSIAQFIHARFGIFGLRRLLKAFKDGRREEDALRQTLFMSSDMLQQSWEFSLRERR